jgi:hypothetical protein
MVLDYYLQRSHLLTRTVHFLANSVRSLPLSTITLLHYHRRIARPDRTLCPMRNVVRFFIANGWGNSPPGETRMPPIILLPSAPAHSLQHAVPTRKWGWVFVPNLTRPTLDFKAISRITCTSCTQCKTSRMPRKARQFEKHSRYVVGLGCKRSWVQIPPARLSQKNTL